MNDCLFCKIINGDIPSKKVYEDELVYAFYDIAPMAPVHVLIIPKKHIASAAEFQTDDAALLMHMFQTAKKIAKDIGIADKGYRLVFNTGADAGQTVFHVHMHLVGGQALGEFGVAK